MTLQTRHARIDTEKETAMRTLLKLIATLVALAATLPAMAQTPFPPINDTARAAMTELRVFAGCHIGRAPRIGIWPLKGDDLPIEDASAVAFYETVFAALNATKPDCVTFVDGASGSDTIQYFMLTGDGAEARGRVDEAFRGVEFILTLDIYDRGGRIRADLKIANANGVTVAAPPTFDVPDDFIDTTCGAGAIPLDRALSNAARELIEKASDITALVDQGGRFGYSDERPSFTDYFSERMIHALEEQVADNLSGRSVRRVDDGALGQPGVYASSFRYWPCDDGVVAEIATELRGPEGRTATWRGYVRLDRVPGILDIFPPEPEPMPEVELAQGPEPDTDPKPETDPEPETDPAPELEEEADPRPVPVPSGDLGLDPDLGMKLGSRPVPVPRTDGIPVGVHALSFTPRMASVGDVVSIVADVAAGCEPFFVNFYQSGALEPLAWEYFVIEDRENGAKHYRIDTTTPTGLKVTEMDPKGTHHVGYICTPGGGVPEAAVLKEIFNGLYNDVLRQTDPGKGPVFLFERYVIQ